jgi:hypothetical protein
VVGIDEEKATLVTSEYVPLETNMVYNRELGTHRYAAPSTMSGRNHRAYCGRALESCCSRSTVPRRQAILRTQAWYPGYHPTNARPAATRLAEHWNRGTHCISGQAAASCIRHYSSGKVTAAIAGCHVQLGQVALCRHGFAKAQSIRSAAIKLSYSSAASSNGPSTEECYASSRTRRSSESNRLSRRFPIRVLPQTGAGFYYAVGIS